MTADAVGGVWTYALDLAAGLARQGVKVTIATMGPPPSADQLRQIAGLHNVELVAGRFKLEWMDDPWADVDDAADWLLRLEERTAPDIVHLNGFAHGALPFRAPKVVVGHSCVLSWWSAVNARPAPARYNEYRDRVTRGLNGADIVAAPTSAMLCSLKGHYGPLDRTAVVANGRDAAFFRSGPRRRSVISAGRVWDKAKNVAAVAEAASSIDAPVAIAGDPHHPNGGEAPAFPNVTMLGKLSNAELAKQLSSAKVFVLPAKYEPFGLTPLEAALSGCALVLGDIPSLREVWGDAALFVPPSDPAAIARAVGHLLDNDGELDAMAERARRRALFYSVERMAAGYRDIYRQLCFGATALPMRREAAVCA